ncbi:MAG TPA: GNAT family N-acetyltransferase [Actinomycetota bacterium]|nr:GNAT family N-acetyltransferase [Actinomycetota bacterium]
MKARAATSDDASAIARVHVASWNAAYRGVIADDALDALTEDRLAPEWRAEIEGSDAGVAVVEDGGDVVGYSRYGSARDADLDPATDAEVYGFYLHPDAWGRGGGRALMEHVKADLRGRGFRTAALWVVQVNEGAQAFYRAVGFEPDGRDDKLCIGAPEYRFRGKLSPQA